MTHVKHMFSLFAFSLALFPFVGIAAEVSDSLRTHQVTGNTYAVVGPYGNRAPENLGNNATFGFVVTDQGVVLIDSGGTWQGAAAIHAKIKEITDKPVRLVINSGGQDHRWLGNGYFRSQGATIIASEAAVEDQKTRHQDQLSALNTLLGSDILQGTEPIYADETFQTSKRLVFGGVTFELLRVGPAHTQGDTLVWLPEQRVVFAGDVVYVGRLLGILPSSNSQQWLEAFDTMARLQPEVIIPGHGPATDIATARQDTRDYLAHIRASVAKLIEAGADITQSGTLDQSRFADLADYENLKGRNAQQVFQHMEWE